MKKIFDNPPSLKLRKDYFSQKVKNKKIAIIDYGVGNLYSLKKALDNFDSNVFITEDPEKIYSADAIILPGVGSFKAGMEGLKIRNLIN